MLELDTIVSRLVTSKNQTIILPRTTPYLSLYVRELHWQAQFGSDWVDIYGIFKQKKLGGAYFPTAGRDRVKG